MEIFSFAQGNGDEISHSCWKTGDVVAGQGKTLIYLEKEEVRTKVSLFSSFSSYISLSIEQTNLVPRASYFVQGLVFKCSVFLSLSLCTCPDTVDLLL